jgi:hypothetical protein
MDHANIYITGDTHGGVDGWKISHKVFHCDKDDLLIVCGDNGFIWEWDYHTNPKAKRSEIYELNKYVTGRRFIMGSVLGNHECYPRIYSEFPEEELYGGKVIRVAPNFFFFKNGEVYTINGQRFFVWGGARSVDKNRRIEGKTWWPEEIPTQADFDNALSNLAKHNWCVDFVLSHTCSQAEIYYFMPRIAAQDATMKDFDPAGIMLGELMSRLSFNHHFFGHLHIDQTIDRATGCYNTVRNLNDFLVDRDDLDKIYNDLDWPL